MSDAHPVTPDAALYGVLLSMKQNKAPSSASFSCTARCNLRAARLARPRALAIPSNIQTPRHHSCAAGERVGPVWCDMKSPSISAKALFVVVPKLIRWTKFRCVPAHC